MSNMEKYDAAFKEVFQIEQTDLTDSLEYQSITKQAGSTEQSNVLKWTSYVDNTIWIKSIERQ